MTRGCVKALEDVFREALEKSLLPMEFPGEAE
jgi:hypothetical protein